MSVIPVSTTYASYGALTITAVTFFGIFKYNQTPNIYGIIGLILIIAGVIILNRTDQQTIDAKKSDAGKQHGKCPTFLGLSSQLVILNPHI